MTGNIYVDEAAFVPVSLLTNVIFPIFEVEDHFLVMVSTLYSHWNFYTRLLDKAEQEEARGNPIINWYRLTLVCKRCMEMGEKAQLSCQHEFDKIPPWKNTHKLGIVKFVQQGGDENAYKRESLGILGGAENPVFAENDVRALETIEPIVPHGNVPCPAVFISVDPNAGGPNNMGVAAVTRYRGYTMICGMDHFNARHPNEVREFFIAFVTRLREIQWLKDATIVFCPERSCGFEITYMAEDLAAVDRDSYTIYEPGQTRPGYATNNERKNAFANALNNTMSLQLLRVMHEFAVVARGATEQEHRVDVLRELTNSMRHAESYALNDSLGGHARVGWSAKHGGDGKRVKTANDDLLLAVAISIYIMNQWIARRIRDKRSLEMYEKIKPF